MSAVALVYERANAFVTVPGTMGPCDLYRGVRTDQDWREGCGMHTRAQIAMLRVMLLIANTARVHHVVNCTAYVSSGLGLPEFLFGEPLGPCVYVVDRDLILSFHIEPAPTKMVRVARAACSSLVALVALAMFLSCAIKLGLARRPVEVKLTLVYILPMPLNDLTPLGADYM